MKLTRGGGTLIGLMVVALMGLRAMADSSAPFDSPISPLPTPTPTPLGPPEVCDLELTCDGIPSRTQKCVGHVVHDEGRDVLVELHSAYKVDDHIPVNSITGETTEWSFAVAFGGVPCFLGKPYATFYLKAIDFFWDRGRGYKCEVIELTHDHCTTLPFVGSDRNE